MDSYCEPWCPPSFSGPPCFPGPSYPGPMYKVNVGFSSETIRIDTNNYGGVNQPKYVTEAISGINGQTTVTGYDPASLGNTPACFMLTINPTLVASCRPSKVVATLMYNQVTTPVVSVNTPGPVYYSSQTVDLAYGTTTKTLTFKFNGTDNYVSGISNPKVFLQYL